MFATGRHVTAVLLFNKTWFRCSAFLHCRRVTHEPMTFERSRQHHAALIQHVSGRVDFSLCQTRRRTKHLGPCMAPRHSMPSDCRSGQGWCQGGLSGAAVYGSPLDRRVPPMGDRHLRYARARRGRSLVTPRRACGVQAKGTDHQPRR